MEVCFFSSTLLKNPQRKKLSVRFGLQGLYRVAGLGLVERHQHITRARLNSLEVPA